MEEQDLALAHYEAMGDSRFALAEALAERLAQEARSYDLEQFWYRRARIARKYKKEMEQ